MDGFKTGLEFIGMVVVGCIVLAGLFYAYAFVSWIYFWRWGKGARFAKTGSQNVG